MCGACGAARAPRAAARTRGDTGQEDPDPGGGRCNFTNIGAGPANYLSANPHFAKSALARYTARDFLALVESHGIAWHEKTLGQLFCDGSAKQIVAMLLEECAKGEVDLRCGEEIASVEQAGGFTVTTQSGRWLSPAKARETGPIAW